MALTIVLIYLGMLVALGVFATRLLKRTSGDYFLAGRTIGPFVLLMSLFGTTMTSFALVGSTGEAFKKGIGVYGLMASWSGIMHSAVFFLVGMRVWAFGKRHGYLTQLAFFRDRYQSELLPLLLFPVVVGLVVIYILMGFVGAGAVLQKVTGLPSWGGMLLISLVVLFYVFSGGLRATAWANTFQTLVFMVLGVVTFWVISSKLGGVVAASKQVLDSESAGLMAREGNMTQLRFFSYCLIPLSVGMFPHLFQHWLTARSAKTFRLAVIAHPICIMVVWVPCVLLGVWAAAQYPSTLPANAILGKLVAEHAPAALGGLLTAGILAAIMSSMDSQFLCIGSMFSNDIVVHLFKRGRVSESQKVLLGRIFVVVVVSATYVIALWAPRSVFQLGVWCFTGFAGLFPIVFAAVYWRRSTKWGAMASVLIVAVATGWLFRAADFGAKREFLVAGMMPVVPIFLLSAAALVVVSLMTRAPEPAVQAKFFDPPRDASGCAAS